MTYHDIDNHNDSNSLSSNDRILSAKKQLQRNDKHFHRLNRNINKEWIDGKFYKRANLDLYGSGGIGSKIRNAVTGERYQYLVGTKEQDMFFSVSLCTGENGLKESVSLFYDSPEQYENHMFKSLDITKKSQWYNKSIAMKRVLNI
jgi:hypothetical protein